MKEKSLTKYLFIDIGGVLLSDSMVIHCLAYRRSNQERFYERGYKEEGTTTAPFDMVMLNEMDRFHLVGGVIDRVPGLGLRAAFVKRFLRDKPLDHKKYIDKYGQDMPEIRNWKWNNHKNNRSKT